MDISKPPWWWTKLPKGIFLLLVMSAIASYFMFAKLNLHPVEKWDEAVNIKVINQTRLAGFWYPLLEGKPFMEKPPLWYWLVMGISQLVPEPLLSARLVSACGGLLTYLAITLFLLLTYGVVAALIADLVFLSSTLLFLGNPGGLFASHTLRSADTDGLYIFFMIMAQLFFLAAFKKNQAGYAALGGFFSALSVTTKSPLGALPEIIFVILTLFRRDGKFRQLRYYSLGAFLLVLTGVLITMISLDRQNFFKVFVQYHLGQRIITAIEGHNQPWWYYLAIIIRPDLFPAGPALIAGYLASLNRPRRMQIEEIFTALMPIVILTAITFTRTKLAWYLLPFFPASAVFIGQTYNRITISNVPGFKYLKLLYFLGMLLTFIKIFYIFMNI
jgi:4-amino-4-deoxy-L-arabinose transferase-like glycosyltransferase